jgi:hypothetical protein
MRQFIPTKPSMTVLARIAQVLTGVTCSEETTPRLCGFGSDRETVIR